MKVAWSTKIAGPCPSSACWIIEFRLRGHTGWLNLPTSDEHLAVAEHCRCMCKAPFDEAASRCRFGWIVEFRANETGGPSPKPPATSTLPFESKVAVCW